MPNNKILQHYAMFQKTEMKQLSTTRMLPHSLNLCTMGYHLQILSKPQHINPLNIHALHSHFLYNPHNPTFEYIMPHQKHSHISKYNFLSLYTIPFNKKQYDPKVMQTPNFCCYLTTHI